MPYPVCDKTAARGCHVLVRTSAVRGARGRLGNSARQVRGFSRPIPTVVFIAGLLASMAGLTHVAGPAQAGDANLFDHDRWHGDQNDGQITFGKFLGVWGKPC